MTNIKTGLYMLITLSVCMGALNTFFQNGKLQKYVKYIVSLIVIYSIFSTFNVSDIKQLLNFNSLTLNHTEQNIDQNMYIKNTVETSLKDNLLKRFNIPQESISLAIDIQEDDEEIIINKIKVSIKDKSYNGYAERINAYLNSEFGAEIEVTQNIRE